MWIMAQEKVKAPLKSNNAQLKGNIALVDRVGNLISVITIVEWLFSGVKTKYLDFSLPGVSEKDIQESSKFGEVILSSLNENNFDEIQQKLLAINAANKSLSQLQSIGLLIKSLINGLILLKVEKNKKKLVKSILYIFVACNLLISPIVYILHIFTYPFKLNKIRKDTNIIKV